MHTIRKIIISLFIFSASVSIARVSFAVSDAQIIQCSASKMTDYDDFDALADDMVDRGVTRDEPKPLSTIDRWVQSICSPVIMKYVLLKGYMRDWGYWMIGVKKN